jgi:hypothetical protein
MQGERVFSAQGVLMFLDWCTEAASGCCNRATVALFALVPFTIIGIFLLIRSRLISKDKDWLPSYARSYFDYLVAEYNAILKIPSAAQDKDERVDRIAGSGPEERLKWSEVFALELWIQNHLTPEELERKAWLVRRRYEVISGPRTFHAYKNSKPPDPVAKTPQELARLRADLGFVLQDVYWLYRIRSAWSQGRDLITKIIGWLLLTATLALIVIAIARSNHCPTPGGVGLLVMYESAMLGATGGLMSLWRRLQRSPSADRRLEGVLEFEHGRLTIMFQSFISGGIFAFTLLLLFASDVVQGPLFPKISLTNDPAPLLEALRVLSEDGAALAKLLAWSFVAGFAERFVPDFLDRLTTSAQSQMNGGGGAAASTSAPATGGTSGGDGN